MCVAVLPHWAERLALALTCADKVPSPCVAVCRIDEVRGLCEGCLRSREEIAAWSRADDTYKRSVWQLIEQRHEQCHEQQL